MNATGADDDRPTTPGGVPGSLGRGRYRVESRIGSGGMGLVFAARDTALERRVAIKMLGDTLSADEEARRRFDREARATAQLNHPNVIQVYDVGEEAGRPYLVMELVDGPSLSERLRDRGRLEPETVAAAARDALAGLSAAHAAGLLHRDLKPANLLQTRSGEIKVGDFGIAVAGDASELTQTGMIVGTLDYLAPERRQGADATVQSDLYALGATLQHLLTGRPPGGETPGHPPGTPAGLRRLISRCTAPRPADRPASAADARALLDGRDDATTRVAGRDDPDGTRPLTGRQEAARERGATADLPEQATAGSRAGVPSWAWLGVLLLLVAAVLAVVIAQGGLPGDVPGGGVEVTNDPADTARNLAEWIRQQAR